MGGPLRHSARSTTTWELLPEAFERQVAEYPP